MLAQHYSVVLTPIYSYDLQTILHLQNPSTLVQSSEMANTDIY
jgi:hypothetical protein